MCKVFPQLILLSIFVLWMISAYKLFSHHPQSSRFSLDYVLAWRWSFPLNISVCMSDGRRGMKYFTLKHLGRTFLHFFTQWGSAAYEFVVVRRSFHCWNYGRSSLEQVLSLVPSNLFNWFMVPFKLQCSGLGYQIYFHWSMISIKGIKGFKGISTFYWYLK